ncbi:MAG: acyltransferase [Sulfurimonas sp.]|jgi:acetyltransferase-like isoleucine patch superfamily enzyme
MINYLYKLYFRLFCGVKFGKSTRIIFPVNLYGCEIGSNCLIGPFTEVQPDVYIGNNTCIQSHSFICAGMKIGTNCFISHGVISANDKLPIFKNKIWKMQPPVIENNCMIGSGVKLLPGVVVKSGSKIGMGAILTKSTEENETWVSPAATKIKPTEKRIGFQK